MSPTPRPNRAEPAQSVSPRFGLRVRRVVTHVRGASASEVRDRERGFFSGAAYRDTGHQDTGSVRRPQRRSRTPAAQDCTETLEGFAEQVYQARERP
jgi:hypothetical protein